MDLMCSQKGSTSVVKYEQRVGIWGLYWLQTS